MKKLLVGLVVLTVVFSASAVEAGIKLEKDVPLSQLVGAPGTVSFNIYETELAPSPIASQTFPAGSWSADHDFSKSMQGMVRFKVDFTNTAALTKDTQLWLEIELDGVVKGAREQIKQAPWALFAEEAFLADDADTVDGVHAAALEESAEIDADIAIHAGIPGAHHTKTASFSELSDSVTDAQIPNNITIDQAANASTAGDADTVDGQHAAAFAAAAHLHDDRYYTKAQVDALEARIVALETLLAKVSLVGNNMVFSGVNVQVKSGSGATNGAINGLGNLIVGYNESSGQIRTGSHNMIIGMKHTYSSYGGLVAGYRNSITGISSSVSGGQINTASGFNSSISGGNGNETSGDFSSVSGGASNMANGSYSSVSGGTGNTASGSYASVSGGNGNTASGLDSSVSGGLNNTVSGNYSSISGGGGNMASGNYSSISGGYLSEASGNYSSVGGGTGNVASYNYASVSGGSGNTASGSISSISGGEYNTASGAVSSISGGRYNTASGSNSSVSGGYNRTASGYKDWAAGSLWEDN